MSIEILDPDATLLQGERSIRSLSGSGLAVKCSSRTYLLSYWFLSKLLRNFTRKLELEMMHVMQSGRLVCAGNAA